MRTFFEQPARYLLFRIGEVFERMPVEDSLGNVSEVTPQCNTGRGCG